MARKIRQGEKIMVGFEEVNEIIIPWIGNVLGFNQIISDKTVVIDAQAKLISDLNLEMKNLKELLESTKKEDKKTILELTEKIKILEEKIIPNPMEEFWNNRYPKISRNYRRQEVDGDYSTDVRNYFQPFDENIPTVTGATFDEKALNALKYVISNVKYTSDKTSYGFDEYWAYAYQTLKRKVGDCEDGAILIANIMLRSGVPYWRIRLNAGSVNGGGHAYVTYCRETDNQFVVLDWCYWKNTLPIKDRKLHSEEQNYDDEQQNYYIWFSWNLKYVFGKMQTMKGIPDYLK